MRNLLALLACTLAWVALPSPAWAVTPATQVTLVTSFDPGDQARQMPWYFGPLKGPYWSYLEDLEKQFRDYFRGTQFEVKVSHFADQNSIRWILQDSRNAAVFIVSHGAQDSGGADGAATGGIFSADGFEMTPVLRDIHPNLRVLSIVGCTSGALTRQLTAEFTASGSNPNLRLIGFDNKIGAKRALGAALKQSHAELKEALADHRPAKACPSRKGLSLFFERTCEAGKFKGGVVFPSLRVEARGHVVATFPECRKAGEVQVSHGVLPLGRGEGISRGDLKLVLNAGKSARIAPDRIELGSLSVERPGESGETWKVFARSSGKPHGVTSHVYRYSGRKLPAAWELEEDVPFSDCR